MTVIARRVVVRRLQQQQREAMAEASGSADASVVNGKHASPSDADIQRIEDTEEVEHLMTRLDPREANVVRMYHLEGKSYQEISQAVGVSENTIGPLLHRARQKMNPS
ncbi:RNA polymerase sigma-E factor-like protein [Rhodopirellula sallentina SM41]|uniref:RNA polymerase sigma-E factor-like protein n=1 Tax=Rhodopirellula sallentina SM41 TaxID=1263870 RepID=M5U8L6_9BACT|nr:RNA polymerase sigma-E factor-like protein [Rhodopirellula sallentina SM41]